ncbi:MAG TPA: FAD-binding oxidoreductase, partial [Pyrinomonadaceae bacterium]|nr:FAD-binding oxidoreductase [Pyrinomonadaceae bacterium]
TADATRLSEILGAPNPGAAITITPKSITEIVEVMKRASESGSSVVPAGAQTWLKSSNQRNGNLVISTLGLNRIVEHEPADLVATAEAGVSLSTFNRELARNGQWLPLDPPDNGAATLGGVVATGLAGPRQFGYGPPRRYVIGMRVVLADGTQIKVGGRVVKNVAGYDLCKLFTGSYGTLGIISEITFKLRPVPETSATLLATGTLTSLLKAGQALMTSALFPVAIEILSAAIVAELELNGTAEHALLIQFAGTQAGVAQQVERAVSTIRRDFATANVMTLEAPSSVWRSIAASETGHEQLSWRGGIQPGKLAEVVCHLTGRWNAGVGSGIVSGDFEGNLEEAIRLQQRMRSLGGWLTIQNSPAELDRIGDEGDPGIMRLMQRIKSELDPRGVFPGLGRQASRLPQSP